MTGLRDIVIVGGGQAGYQTAASLRQEGYDGRLRLVCGENHLPYQRPPLSKAYLAGKASRDTLEIRPAAFYEANAIEVLLDTEVVAIDRASSSIETRTGERLSYDALVLATGTRARPLPLPGGDLDGVYSLRSIADADDIATALGTASRVVIVGGGFIGLEIAATARAHGKEVTILEAMPRLMGRAVTPETSRFFLDLHRGLGSEVRLGTRLAGLGGDGHVAYAELADGTQIPADLIIVGIGAIPNDELASAAGIKCDNGIVADDCGQTSDPKVWAVGDCTSHPNPFAGRLFRLESVQNATDQAKALAKAMLGDRAPYNAVPWFWSDQADAKLQMTGLAIDPDRFVTRGDPATGKFSVFAYRDGKLIAVDSISKPADHMVARRLIQAGISPDPDMVADETSNLKELLK